MVVELDEANDGNAEQEQQSNSQTNTSADDATATSEDTNQSADDQSPAKVDIAESFIAFSRVYSGTLGQLRMDEWIPVGNE